MLVVIRRPGRSTVWLTSEIHPFTPPLYSECLLLFRVRFQKEIGDGVGGVEQEKNEEVDNKKKNKEVEEV